MKNYQHNKQETINKPEFQQNDNDKNIQSQTRNTKTQQRNNNKNVQNKTSNIEFQQKKLKNYTNEMFVALIERLNQYYDCQFLSSKQSPDKHFHTFKYQTEFGELKLQHDTWGNNLHLTVVDQAMPQLLGLVESIQTMMELKTPVKSRREIPKNEPKQQKVEEKVVEAPKTEKHKPTFVLKKFTQKNLDSVIEKLKQIDGITFENPVEVNEGKPNHITRYVANTKTATISLQFTMKSSKLQLQGKKSELFDQALSAILESQVVEKPVKPEKAEKPIREEKVEVSVKAPIKTRKTPEKLQKPVDKVKIPKPQVAEKIDPSFVKATKKVQKLLPNAFNRLTENEKTQLINTMIDLDSNVRNFSGILVPAFGTLENIIASLQRGEGIIVKMIGQAYEKEGEKYILKYAYVKKIKSVIFVEVILALYNEYNNRHGYVHTDIESGSVRIVDRSSAKQVYEEILQAIDYNFRKLHEINYFYKKQ